MPRRIIIHAGFHKTGTSTIQATLRENRMAMKKHAALRLRWHMQELLSATRGYATWRDPITLMKVQNRFEALLDRLPGMPRRTLILSAEELVGHLPGRGDLMNYSAAPILLHTYWEIAKKHFPAANIQFYLSTRAPEAWLASAYWEHVKSSNMTLNFDAFREKYPDAANLDEIVAEVAARVPVPVHQCALEACQNLPLGPAQPLLNLCDLPTDLLSALAAPPPANTRPNKDILAAMLEANRTHKGADARNAAKAAILNAARHP